MAGTFLQKSIIPNFVNFRSSSTGCLRGRALYNRPHGSLPRSRISRFIHAAGLWWYQSGSRTDEPVDDFEFGDDSTGICADDGTLK